MLKTDSPTEAKLCLIDGHSIVYRAFYAIQAAMTNSSGQPTNAVFGFLRMLKRILEDVAPGYLAVCFDVGRVTHRTAAFAAYKEHRAPTPDALISQFSFVREAVRAHNIAIFEKKGFEADDVIATLVERMSPLFKKIVIVSSDKDILQLVGDHVEVYNPYKEEGLVYTPAAVQERFGVAPGQIVDLIALMGDVSDNIPGAKGIGEKTAQELLKVFGGVEDLLKHPERIVRASVRKIVDENREAIVMSRDLAVLRRDVPFDVTPQDLAVKPPDVERLWDLYTRLEFKGMLKDLSAERLNQAGSVRIEVPRRDAQDVPGMEEAVRRAGWFACSFYVDPADAVAWQANVAWDEKGVVGTSDPAVLKRLFSIKNVTVVAHDAKAVRHALGRIGVSSDVAFFDVMLAGYVLEAARGLTGLEALLWNHLDLKGVSALDLQGKESHFLGPLRDILARKLTERGQQDLFYNVEMPLSGVLFDMETAGVRVDAGHLKKLAHEIDARLEKIIRHVHEAAGGAFNVNSPKQLADVLFTKLKLPSVKRTKTGFSTDEEVLSTLARDHELPRMLLEYRGLAKLKSTYVDVLPKLCDANGRVHTTYHQIGTETGRLSSSDPNLQNIPARTELGRRIREAFVAGPGYDRLISVDYSQIELRVLAHLSKDPVLIEAFRQGVDIHRVTAALIFGVEEDAVTDEMRDNAKRINFGILYGMSAYGLAKDLKIDPKTAEAFIDAYFARYPSVKAFLDSQIAFVREHGYVATLLGRRRAIPEIKNANPVLRQFAERQAINAPIQGSAADLIKMAMMAIHDDIRSKGWRSRLVLQVHDELVFEVMEEEEAALIALVRERMEGVRSLDVPLTVTVKTGTDWARMKEIK